MKKFFLIASLLMCANVAFACINSGELTICPGDRAVVADGDGQVLATNPITKQVSIDFSKGRSFYTGIQTYDISMVSVGKGCLKGYCVGDRAVVEDGDGVIIGVNPIADKVAIDFRAGRSSYAGIQTYDIDMVSIGKGCLVGYCVGDRAVVEDGDGLIIGVNPFEMKASIDFHYGRSPYNGINTYDLSMVSVASYCEDYAQNSYLRNTRNQEEFSSNFSRR